MTTGQSHKRRGARFEIQLANALEADERFSAQRLPRSGNKDQGDLFLHDHKWNERWVVEAKAPGRDGRINLPEWWRQTVTETGHYRAAHSGVTAEPLLVVKARSRPVMKSWAIMPLDVFFMMEEWAGGEG